MPRPCKHQTLMRDIRKEAGLTQYEFARQLGISSQSVNCIENKEWNITPENLVRLHVFRGDDPRSIIEHLVEEYRAGLERVASSVKPLVKEQSKTLAQVAYEASPEAGQQNFGPWHSAPAVVREVHKTMVAVVLKEARRREKLKEVQ